MRILFFVFSTKAVLLLYLINHTSDALREISNEDIRDAILSLVHMFRDNTDKLERHEYRERQLGEQFKKIFNNIEKTQKIEEIAMNATTETLADINNRLQEIESFMQQEKSKPKETEWQTKTFQHIATKIENIETTVSEKIAKVDSQTDILNHLNGLENGIRHLEDELKLVREKLKEPPPIPLTTPTTTTTTTESIMAHTTPPSEPSIVEIKLTALQESLAALREEHSKTSQYQQEVLVNEMKSGVGKIVQRMEERLPKKEDVEEATNKTCVQLREIKYDLLLNTEKAVSRLLDAIDRVHETLDNERDKVQNALTDNTDNLEKWYVANVQTSYLQLLKEISRLSKVEQVLIQTADNVLDTKKRIEYGTHRILVEVSDLIKQQTSQTNVTLNKKLDEATGVLLENQNKASTNLSSKIEVEIGQVWRQINVMYQTLTYTSSSLKHLENQTELYVNGSLNTMYNMENKVGQIRSGMLEVDDNLNYLLGRLSLVTQEFNQIKVGLGEALEQVKANLHAVKAGVEKDTGPGPNYFENNVTNPDFPPIQLTKTQLSSQRK